MLPLVCKVSHRLLACQGRSRITVLRSLDRPGTVWKKANKRKQDHRPARKSCQSYIVYLQYLFSTNIRTNLLYVNAISNRAARRPAGIIACAARLIKPYSGAAFNPLYLISISKGGWRNMSGCLRGAKLPPDSRTKTNERHNGLHPKTAFFSR